MIAAATQERTATTSTTQYLVFQSRAMKRIVRHVRRFANSAAPVLITGESGTGKEMIARMLHSESHRANKPYVRVNCAALSESLVESELFGHERGAFTGATMARVGRFEHAGDGTLLLDEVSETPVAVQAKLLRVLESNEFQRVGSNSTLSTDARVIATSNRPLEDELAAKRFRTDLYYRLNILRVHLPALRERAEDIPVLISHFVNQFSASPDSVVERASARAVQQLCEYEWPGNVRQLRNVVQRACLLSENSLLEAGDFDLDAKLPEPSVQESFDNMELSEIERHVILKRLQQYNGNKTAAANNLGVSPRTLTNKMNLYREHGYV